MSPIKALYLRSSETKNSNLKLSQIKYLYSCIFQGTFFSRLLELPNWKKIKKKYIIALSGNLISPLRKVYKNTGFQLYSGMLTAQKMKLFIKNFFSKCDQIRRELPIWSHLVKKSLMENFIFCAVFYAVNFPSI